MQNWVKIQILMQTFWDEHQYLLQKCSLLDSLTSIIQQNPPCFKTSVNWGLSSLPQAWTFSTARRSVFGSRVKVNFLTSSMNFFNRSVLGSRVKVNFLILVVCSRMRWLRFLHDHLYILAHFASGCQSNMTALPHCIVMDLANNKTCHWFSTTLPHKQPHSKTF